MTISEHIENYLLEQKATGEMNPYVFELLMARLPQIQNRHRAGSNMEDAIEQELKSLNMEPNYQGYGEFMMPMSRQEALQDFDESQGVYLIYPNDAEGFCEDRSEIESGDFYFAYEVVEPQSLLSIIPEQHIRPMVYIASPLRGDYNQNIQNAVEYCRLASIRGVLPMAPHIIFSQWCNDTVLEQREQGLQLGLSLLEKSEELWVMGTRISEGMRGEIDFADAHGIPTYYVSRPMEQSTYPISADNNRLLSISDCIVGSQEESYKGQTVVLNHDRLGEFYRTPRNQLWIATHGPGCETHSLSDTVHLLHSVDGDRTCVGRGEICSVVKPEVLAQMTINYPEFCATPVATEQGEEFCR